MASIFSLKTIIALLVVAILGAGLFTSVKLVQQQTQLKSKAASCDDYAAPRAAYCGGKLNLYDNCTSKCEGGKMIYRCTASQNENCTTPDGVWCSAEDSECVSPPAGGTECPLDHYEQVGNQELIDKCTLAELALLPNDRLITFPLGITTQFRNERLKTFSLEFLAKFPNDRLKTFSIEFLQKFPNDRLITFSLDVLAQFPLERIRTFPCDIQQKLGYTCAAGASPSSSPAPDTGIKYRIASGNTHLEALEKLAGAAYQDYLPLSVSKTMFINHPLTDPQPGQLVFVAVQFKKGTVEKEAAVKAIKFIGEKPQIQSILCEYTAAGDETKVTITGSDFGPQERKGSISGRANIAILSWNDNQVVAVIPQKITDKPKLKVKTADNQESAEAECAVGVTSVDFKATTQCAANFSADNVDVKIFENNVGVDPKKPFHSQKLRLGNGKPQGLDVKLQEGKNYSLIIKAPKTLAKRIDFNALSGTTVLDQTVNLPVGDIAPVSAPDGRINALDTSELKRQWSLVTDVERAGDLNGDSRVNSIDYSCMKKDFDPSRGDEEFRPPVVPAPSPSPSPSPT